MVLNIEPEAETANREGELHPLSLLAKVFIYPEPVQK
jgi:hypothetical protein